MRCQKLMSHKSGASGEFNVLLNFNSVYFEKKYSPLKISNKAIIMRLLWSRDVIRQEHDQ